MFDLMWLTKINIRTVRNIGERQLSSCSTYPKSSSVELQCFRFADEPPSMALHAREQTHQDKSPHGPESDVLAPVLDGPQWEHLVKNDRRQAQVLGLIGGDTKMATSSALTHLHSL